MLSLLFLVAAAPALGQFFFARIGIQSDSVMVGEPMAVNIRAAGMPSRPDTSHVSDFSVEYLGKRWDPALEVTMFSYRFRALRAGALEIPPIPVKAGDLSTRTARVKVQARRPEERGATLSLKVSEPCCFVNQQVNARLTFRLAGGAHGLRFDLPFLTDKRLTALLVNSDFIQPGLEGYQRVRINESHAFAKRLALNAFAVDLILIPREAGKIQLGPATAWANAGPYLGPLGSNERLGTASAPVKLEVRELPAEGKPVEFSGLVGPHEVEATASATEVEVGEPFRLYLTLSGPVYLADATLPPIGDRLRECFQVLDGGSRLVAGETKKQFEFTLRPRNHRVAAIPPIRYSYFDPREGGYVQTRTRAIPLRVAANRIVTSADAEGEGRPTRRTSTPVDWRAGIAHNYEGDDALVNRRVRLQDARWLALLLLPALLFAALLGWRRFFPPKQTT